MSSLKDIHWMASPLAIEQRLDLNSKRGKYLGPLTRVIDPTKEYHFFRKIQHWTLEIDGKCYELAPDTKKKLKVIKLTTLVGGDTCDPHDFDAEKWHQIRKKYNIEPEVRKVGQTRMSADEIKAKMHDIWDNYNHGWYGFFTQNCQNLATMLYSCIAVDISDSEKDLWDRMPDPISYRLAEASQASLAGRAALGTRSAYLAAVASAAPAAETAVEGAGVIGAAGVTSTGATTGGTVAAGGSVSSAGAATGGTVAAGSTVTSAGAATGGTAAAGGTTAGSTAGTLGAANGGTVAGTGAAKVGIGAKIAAVGHGALHGPGAVKAAAIGAKLSVGFAMVHPLSGAVVTGGLIYVAVRGKRGKKWRKGKKGQEELDELSVSEMLEAEDDLLEQAENKTDEELLIELDDRDEKIDEALAEDLKLTLVTTEPAKMPEETSISNGAVPSGEDTKRSQTTV